MKKNSKIILWIIAVIVIIMGIVYYLLVPDETVNIDTKNKIITTEDLIRESSINSFKVLGKPLVIQGELAISSKEFKNIIYTLMDKYNIKELKHTYIQINKNKIKTIYPYKILGIINSQYEIDIVPSVENNNLNVKLTNLKVGKLKISDKLLNRILSTYKNKIPFNIKDNSIIVDKSYIYPITLEKVDIQEDNIILYVVIRVNNVLDFIKKNDIKINM